MRISLENRLAALESRKVGGAGRVFRVRASGHSHDEVLAAIAATGINAREEDLIIIRNIVGADRLPVARLHDNAPVVFL